MDDDQSLWLVRTSGTEVKLPVVRARDLPRLAAVSGAGSPTPRPLPRLIGVHDVRQGSPASTRRSWAATASVARRPVSGRRRRRAG